jgi:ribosomal protein S8
MIFKPASTKSRHYTKLPNDLLRDKDLTPEAIGLLCYLLSHIDNWRVTQSQLSKHFSCTPARIRNIADTLEEHGYIRRVRYVERGKTVFDWEVYDEKQLPVCEKAFVENRQVDIAHVGNPQERITIEKEETSSKKKHWKEDLFDSCPSGIPKRVWEQWWEYKTGNRKPSKVTVTRQTNDFETMAKHGYDLRELIPFSISRGWQRIGSPDWDSLDRFKNISRNDDLLAEVK